MVDFDYPEHHCRSLHEAIALADSLRENSDFDIFRGQRHTFPICPSIFRPNIDIEEASERLNSLASWIHSNSDLSSLHDSDDAIIAVAQHYGIATPFLDFTYSPQVAGFFASDGAQIGDTGTIICIDRKTFTNSWADINRRRIEKGEPVLTDIIEIEVSNLWRLQAQQGLFVRSHVSPNFLELFSNMLHIYFPQQENIHIYDREIIYPTQKSHLEVVLDHYFLIESYPKRAQRMRMLYGPPICSITEDDVVKEIEQNFKEERLPDIHHSWRASIVEHWLIEPNEIYDIADTHYIRTIQLSDSDYTPSLNQQLLDTILKLIVHNDDKTRANILWNVLLSNGKVAQISGDGSVTDEKDEYTEFKMSEMVDVIYAGMRYLPYSDYQIACAISRYILMAQFGCYNVIQDAEGVEFSSDGVRSGGCCSRLKLRNAIRDDFIKLVKPNLLDKKGNLLFRDLIYLARYVKTSYLFDKFIDLFIEDLLPSQAAFALEGLVITVNPVKIVILGES